jgi:glucosyl-3-phosphoglycerate phosphatase
LSRIFLVRHGESEWNAEGRLQGQADPALSALGREQARAVAAVVAALPATQVVSSDLSRAQETAALAGHPGAATDARWRERSLGEWETHLEEDVATPDDMRRFRAGDLVPAGGEAWPDFQARVAGAAEELAAAGGDWLVFTHGGCVRALTAHVTGADWRTVVGPANTSLSVLDLGKRRRMLAFNWTPTAPGLAKPSDP